MTGAIIESFLDELYLAAGEADRWDDVMHGLMRLFDADKSHLVVYDNNTGDVRKANFIGVNPKFIEQGHAYYFALEPWVLAFRKQAERDPTLARTDLVLHGDALVPFPVFRETEYYRDFCRHTGTDDCIAFGGLSDRNHRFGVVVNTGDGRLFGQRDLEIARQLRTHIPRAMRLHSRISASAGVRHLEHFWEGSKAAILIVQGMKLEYLNAAAKLLVSEGCVLGVKGGRLQFDDVAVHAAFDHMSSRGGSSGEQRAHCLSFQTTQDNGSRWLVQLVRMKSAGGTLKSLTGRDEPSVMVAITPLSTHAAARQHAIAGFGQLTDAEREILMLLVQGASVEQIAEGTGRKLSTIRWYARCLIEKLEASSLADVVRIGSLLLPV